MNFADCQKAFTRRCPHNVEITALRARAGRGFTYYDPKYWEQAQKYCGGCEEFQSLRGSARESGRAPSDLQAGIDIAKLLT